MGIVYGVEKCMKAIWWKSDQQAVLAGFQIPIKEFDGALHGLAEVI